MKPCRSYLRVLACAYPASSVPIIPHKLLLPPTARALVFLLFPPARPVVVMIIPRPAARICRFLILRLAPPLLVTFSMTKRPRRFARPRAGPCAGLSCLAMPAIPVCAAPFPSLVSRFSSPAAIGLHALFGPFPAKRSHAVISLFDTENHTNNTQDSHNNFPVA